MVDRYWQKIESVENNIENSMQISSILLKLKGYDEKLGDLCRRYFIKFKKKLQMKEIFHLIQKK